jgi:hypothetical protein
MPIDNYDPASAALPEVVWGGTEDELQQQQQQNSEFRRTHQLETYKVICDSTTVPHHQLMLENRLSTAAEIRASIAEYMERIRDEKIVTDFRLGIPVEYKYWIMTKQGAVTFFCEVLQGGEHGARGSIVARPFTHPWVGPHRPRRRLRKYLNSIVGRLDWPIYVTPIIPVQYISLVMNVSPSGVTFSNKVAE